MGEDGHLPAKETGPPHRSFLTAPRRNRPPDTSISGFWLPDREEMHLCCFSPTPVCLWYFVAALGPNPPPTLLFTVSRLVYM